MTDIATWDYPQVGFAGAAGGIHRSVRQEFRPGDHGQDAEETSGSAAPPVQSESSGSVPGQANGSRYPVPMSRAGRGLTAG